MGIPFSFAAVITLISGWMIPVKIIVDINATEIRKRILEDDNWQELVPKEVAEEIIRMGGVERIKKV